MSYPSSGTPYDSALGEFAPKGEPENLNVEGGSKPECEPEVNAALGEFGGLSGPAKKSSSLAADAEKIAVPLEDVRQSLYNRKV